MSIPSFTPFFFATSFKPSKHVERVSSIHSLSPALHFITHRLSRHDIPCSPSQSICEHPSFPSLCQSTTPGYGPRSQGPKPQAIQPRSVQSQLSWSQHRRERCHSMPTKSSRSFASPNPGLGPISSSCILFQPHLSLTHFGRRLGCPITWTRISPIQAGHKSVSFEVTHNHYTKQTTFLVLFQPHFIRTQFMRSIERLLAWRRWAPTIQAADQSKRSEFA